MKEVIYEKIAERVIEGVSESGLRVVVIPKSGYKKTYALLATDFGSIDRNFFLGGQEVTVPDGIAHFLEHKMFEVESGDDPFAFFAKTGTGTNAGTSYKKTSYFIYGVNNLKENLYFFIEFVNTPYFTDENVEKEKGIIIEEIKMYDDNPDWIIAEEIQKSTFNGYLLYIALNTL